MHKYIINIYNMMTNVSANDIIFTRKIKSHFKKLGGGLAYELYKKNNGR